MTDGWVMMLIEVSSGCCRSRGDGMVEYVVDETDMLGHEGVMGWTGRSRAWYQASTVTQDKHMASQAKRK